MSAKAPLTTAQFMDVFFHRCAVALLFVSLGFVLDVAEFALGPASGPWLGYLSTGVGFLVIVVLFPWFVRFVYRVRKIGVHYEVDGYVIEMFRRSCARSFEVTFIFMLVLEVLAGGVLEAVPGEVLLHAVLSVSLAVASLMFLYLVRSAEGEGDLDDDGSGGGDA